jgi:hypothetical protein
LSSRFSSLFLLAALLWGAVSSPCTAQFTSPPVQSPANGHWYQAVRVAGAISWDDARSAAESLTHLGLRGHLLTVTSAPEMEFVARTVLSTVAPGDQLWLGGYQDTNAPDYVESRGAWRWVTGEPWSYTNWENGQPDNYGGNEDALDFHHGQVWNDFPRSSGLHGYVVEYEPLPIATGPLLSVEPNPVAGGQSAVGQVILAQPAGLGGVVLTLSGSNPAAAVAPASVTVPTGANTITFPLVTFSVASPTDATISVTSSAGSASTVLRVLPPSAPAPLQPVYNPANGHWYQVVTPTSELSWQQAREAAAALSHAGLPGHLATVTSLEENQFIWDQVIQQNPSRSDYYLGGYQDRSASDYREPAGGWRWVTGEPWNFTLWASIEPNDTAGIEDVLGYWGPQLDHWNDFNPAPRKVPFIVEYEPQLQSLPQPVYNPANGHWYQYIRLQERITWPDARAAAERLSFAGYRGHLATVTSATENQFVSQLTTAQGPLGDIWIGGYQERGRPGYSEPAGGWRWVTGEPWSYTSWSRGEPNNAGGGEDVLETNSGGTWNDLPAHAGITAYLVEFEPQPVPVSVAQLILFPNPVPGGMMALGQVVLAQPAGASGSTLTLVSSNPAAASVPADVPVPPGATTATFAILTFPVGEVTPVRITVGGGQSPIAETLQVLPLVAPPSPITTSNLLINGSFEQPSIPNGMPFLTLRPESLPGWRIVRGTVDVHQSWQQAPGQGRQSLGLVGDQAGAVEQSFRTEPGREYLFSGWVSHDYGSGVTEGRANVHLNGAFFVQLYHNVPATEADMRWTPFAYRFRASAAVTTLTLTDVTGRTNLQGTVLDGLSITPVTGANPPQPPPAARAPAAPTDLRAERVFATQVDLSWRDNSDNEQEFILWRRSGGADFVRIGKVGPNVTRFSDTGLQPLTTYSYLVRAWNPSDASRRSNELTVKTAAPETPAPLAAPSGVSATAISSTEIRLNWIDDVAGEAVFVVYRMGPGSPDFVKHADVPANRTSFVDQGLAPGTRYTYLVRAWHPDRGVSRRSNEASATTPLAQ